MWFDCCMNLDWVIKTNRDNNGGSGCIIRIWFWNDFSCWWFNSWLTSRTELAGVLLDVIPQFSQFRHWTKNYFYESLKADLMRAKQVFFFCSGDNFVWLYVQLIPIRDAMLSGGTLQIHQFKDPVRDIQKWNIICRRKTYITSYISGAKTSPRLFGWIDNRSGSLRWSTRGWTSRARRRAWTSCPSWRTASTSSSTPSSSPPLSSRNSHRRFWRPTQGSAPQSGNVLHIHENTKYMHLSSF